MDSLLPVIVIYVLDILREAETLARYLMITIEIM
jgi:hypothetical protein